MTSSRWRYLPGPALGALGAIIGHVDATDNNPKTTKHANDRMRSGIWLLRSPSGLGKRYPNEEVTVLTGLDHRRNRGILHRAILEWTAYRNIIQTNPKEITSWELEAALRDIKNGTATGNDLINIETLKAGEDTISKTLAKLYTKCLSERRIPTAWKNAKVVIIFRNGNKNDLKSYRPIYLLSNIYKILTKNNIAFSRLW